MNQPAFTFKRGGTFTATIRFRPKEGGLANYIGANITSTIKDARNSGWSLDCTLANDGLSVVVYGDYDLTRKFASGIARWDVRIEIGGVVVHTPTITFVIEQEITSPTVWIAQ